MATIFGFLYMGVAHCRHLANMTEPSVCSGDAALCQISLTKLFCVFWCLDVRKGHSSCKIPVSHSNEVNMFSSGELLETNLCWPQKIHQLRKSWEYCWLADTISWFSRYFWCLLNWFYCLLVHQWYVVCRIRSQDTDNMETLILHGNSRVYLNSAHLVTANGHSLLTINFSDIWRCTGDTKPLW